MAKKDSKKKALTSQKVGALIRKQLNRKTETKMFGTSALEQAISSSVTDVVYADVSQVAGGTGPNDRVGSKINPFGLYLSYIGHNNGDVAGYLRVMVIRTMTGENATAGSELFSANDGAGQTAAAERLTDVFFRPNSYAFDTLYDKTHRIAGLGDGTGVETVSRKRLIKLRKNELKFSSESASDADMNNLRLIVLWRNANNDFSVPTTCEFSYQTMLYFKDY